MKVLGWLLIAIVIIVTVIFFILNWKYEGIRLLVYGMLLCLMLIVGLMLINTK